MANTPDYTVSWEKDGEGSIRSSMEVLIDWFTTKENVSKYYGGTDKHGTTNAERKEGYHLSMKNLIQEENGKSFSFTSLQLFIITYICITHDMIQFFYRKHTFYQIN
jgi:hypothetical protein